MDSSPLKLHLHLFGETFSEKAGMKSCDVLHCSLCTA
ncbi:hypothetical protein LEMLEM_LOCUS22575, partial [Lemmus lemmus]